MRFLVLYVALLAAAAAVSAFQGAGMLGRLSSASRKLNEFLVAQQLPAPQDELKHLVGTAESAVVDGVPAPLNTMRELDSAFLASIMHKKEEFTITGPYYATNNIYYEYKARYNSLMRSGQTYGQGQFGRLVDKAGTPLLEGGEAYVSNDPDFSSLLPKGGNRVWQITHFEDPKPAAAYLSQLLQDPATGNLSVISTQVMDWSEYDGLWTPCAGSVTPWQSHLGSEEYEPDARVIADNAAGAPAGQEWLEEDIARYVTQYLGHNDSLTNAEVAQVARPYLYGYIWEASVSEAGVPAHSKHVAMGRLSFELAYVLPNDSQRRVYMTDDGDNRMLAHFVSATPGSLDCGTLWGAAVTQTSALNGGSFSVAWVQIGPPACDSDVLPHLRNTTFYDIFAAAEPTDDVTCPAGYSPVKTGETKMLECLQVLPGMELLASRLETRRYADMLGVTVEFSKMEGLAYDPARGSVYLAMSTVRRGMEDMADKGEPSAEYDQPAAAGGNDVRLPYNDCGCVYRLDLDEQGWAVNMTAELCGSTEGADAANACGVDGIANPDNLAFVHGHDGLLIAEDSSNHEVNYHWLYNTADKTLTRLASVPYGAEVTGSYWYPNINGWAYMLMNVQHPYEDHEDKLGEPGATGLEGWVGYLGPFVAQNDSVSMLLGQSSTHLWNGFPVPPCDANSTAAGAACAADTAEAPAGDVAAAAGSPAGAPVATSTTTNTTQSANTTGATSEDATAAGSATPAGEPAAGAVEAPGAATVAEGAASHAGSRCRGEVVAVSGASAAALLFL